MDVARTSFVLTIAAVSASFACAAPPSSGTPAAHTVNFAGASDWSSAPATTAPTITASPNDRYGYPPSSTQPLTQRAQNAVNETASSLRDGFNSGVNSAGQQVQSWSGSATQQVQATGNGARTSAQQAFGTVGYPSSQTAPPSYPFATQSQPTGPAPAASSTSRNSVAAPPWPTSTAAPATSSAPSWSGSTTPVTPVDRSVLANPSTTQSSGTWTSIGSTIAAPPLLAPTFPSSTSSNNFPPLNTTPLDGGPSFTTDSYRGGQLSNNSPNNSIPQSSPQSSPPPNGRSNLNEDNWAETWDGSADKNRAAISRSDTNTSRTSSTRDPDFPASPRLGSTAPEVRNAAAKQTDAWMDDSWSRQTPAQIGSKAATIGATSNTAPGIQPPANAPPLSPPVVGSANGNMAFGGSNQNIPQQPTIVSASKPTQATAGEPQPWVTLLVTILALAASLAGNVYLGWSYLDARQKYQALVRRTADTFRRTKAVAA